MTTSPRPNLGGLFNGSTPPERSSTVVAALGPRLVTAPPAAGSDVPAGRVPDSATPEPTLGTEAEPQPDPAVGNPRPMRVGGTTQQPSAPVPPLGMPPAQSGISAALELIDPLRAVERYFAVLQVVLDVNRRIAMAVTSTAIAFPRRAGIWR